MEQNPYAPPTDDSRPGPTGQGDDGFIEGGRGVSATRGSAWLTEGWDIVKGNVGSWILIFLLYILLGVVVYFTRPVGQIVLAVLAPVISGGLLIGCRDTKEGREFGVGHFFEGFKKPVGLLAIGGVHLLWQLVLGGIGAVLGGGGIFSSPPAYNPALGFPVFMQQLQPVMRFAGISMVLGIPITMATFYAPALVALRDMSPLAALTNSFLGASKNVLPYIVYALVLFVFALGAAIPCGLGLFLLVPVSLASIYVSYRDVFYADNPAP